MSNTESHNMIGRSVGAGTFKEGTVTKTNGQYHLTGSSQRGLRFECYVDTVYVGYEEEINMENGEKRDVSNKQFRLGDGELHLR